jgi:HTH-type transcriptional regulator/antitoxin HigA
MNRIKIIKSDHEHEQALARLVALMDADPAEGSQEADELDVLALLIEQYEQVHFPMDSPDPIQAIEFRMDQMGLKNKDLVPYIGSAPKVSEVLNRRRPLSLTMIRKLSDGLGISADVLIREPIQEVACGNDIDWHAFPLTEMHKRGYFEGFTGKLGELKKCTAEQVSCFLKSVADGFSLQPTMLRTNAHLRSNDKETDSYALWAWQVRVLQKAQQDRLSNKYVKGSVTQEWMQTLARFSWSEKGPLLAREYLNQIGIHLIVEPHLPKTYLDGAVCISQLGNPVVALTLRHDRLDNFWLTLMHELAHIALHLDGVETWYMDNLDIESGDPVEQEADSLAQEVLIPANVWQLGKRLSVEKVRDLAKRLSISPCIIAGRIRHERNNHRLYGKLFRDKIKHHFV